MVQKVFQYTKTIVGMWQSTHVIFHLVTKTLFLLKNDPNRLYGGEKLPFISIFRPFWGLFHAPGTQIGFKIGSHISKWSLERGDQLTLYSIWSKSHYFWSKTSQKEKNPKKMKKMKNFLIFFFVYKTEKKLKRDCLQTSPG